MYSVLVVYSIADRRQVGIRLSTRPWVGRPMSVRKALSFTNELYLFLYFVYQSTVLSSHAVYGQQMYSGGSFVGKASTDLAHP